MFSKSYAENELGGLVSELFLFFEEGLCKFKASGQHLSLVNLHSNIQ